LLQGLKRIATAPEWRRFRAIVYRYLALFVLYALSIGPMYWKWYAAIYAEGPGWIVAFYYPLWLLSGAIPPLGHFLNWYIRLWIL
jgi:hypothetical protein